MRTQARARTLATLNVSTLLRRLAAQPHGPDLSPCQFQFEVNTSLEPSKEKKNIATTNFLHFQFAIPTSTDP